MGTVSKNLKWKTPKKCNVRLINGFGVKSSRSKNGVWEKIRESSVYVYVCVWWATPATKKGKVKILHLPPKKKNAQVLHPAT